MSLLSNPTAYAQMPSHVQKINCISISKQSSHTITWPLKFQEKT